MKALGILSMPLTIDLNQVVQYYVGRKTYNQYSNAMLLQRCCLVGFCAASMATLQAFALGKMSINITIPCMIRVHAEDSLFVWSVVPV